MGSFLFVHIVVMFYVCFTRGGQRTATACPAATARQFFKEDNFFNPKGRMKGCDVK